MTHDTRDITSCPSSYHSGLFNDHTLLPMNTIFLFAIKSAFVLALLYMPYTLLLRQEKFFRFNRLTLLAILLLSLVMPWCNFSAMSLDCQPVVHTAQQQMIEIGIPVMQVDDGSGATASPADGISWFYVAAVIYILGMVGVLAVRGMQLAKMGMVIRGGSLWKHCEDGVNIYCHADDVAPFSWLKNIVINKEDYESNGKEIITHEKGHIRSLHSLDILLLTFVQMIQWWNPMAYMLGISLRDVHEYEADDYVLHQGISLYDYQTLLIRKAVGASSYTFANNFNHSLIKKRITMMCKRNSNPWRRGKVLYALPMVAVALSAFATPKFVKPIEEAVQSITTQSESLESSTAQNLAPESGTSGSLTAGSTASEAQKPLDDCKGNEISGNSQISSSENDMEGVSRQTNLTATKDTVAQRKDNNLVMPKFEGGQAALMMFLSETVRYPKIAEDCKATGRVVVQFVVEKDGSVSELMVMSNSCKADNLQAKDDDQTINVIGYKDKEGKARKERKEGKERKRQITEQEYLAAKKALEGEALRVVSLTSGKWTPGEMDGEKVRVKFFIPIIFSLR